MLKVCSKALLLSDVKNFALMYKQLATELEVDMRIEKEWKDSFRVREEVVICGTKYFECINRAYYPILVLIMKPGENPFPYIKKGASRFIFDHENAFELAFALMLPEKAVLHTASDSLKDILKDSTVTSFVFGDYEFFFDKNRFIYKGKPIYMADSTKRYLAEWLLNGHKDNKKRMILCNLRKKFGAEFLKDVDRFGQLKEEKNEQ